MGLFSSPSHAIFKAKLAQMQTVASEIFCFLIGLICGFDGINCLL